jgi:hypothetical protein
MADRHVAIFDSIYKILQIAKSMEQGTYTTFYLAQLFIFYLACWLYSTLFTVSTGSTLYFPLSTYSLCLSGSTPQVSANWPSYGSSNLQATLSLSIHPGGH